MFISIDLKNIDSVWKRAVQGEVSSNVDESWLQDFKENIPIQQNPGMFLCGSLNFQLMYLDDSWDEYFLQKEFEEWIKFECLMSVPPTYGVCDSIEQFCKTQIFDFYNKSANEYIVSFCPITKECVGWRWEKWGEYIGEQTRTAEYIEDEQFIEKVFVFTIHKKVK